MKINKIFIAVAILVSFKLFPMESAKQTLSGLLASGTALAQTCGTKAKDFVVTHAPEARDKALAAWSFTKEQAQEKGAQGLQFAQENVVPVVQKYWANKWVKIGVASTAAVAAVVVATKLVFKKTVAHETADIKN